MVGAAVLMMGCAGAGQDRFASPVAPLSGCYAFNYGPWPGDLAGDGAAEEGTSRPQGAAQRRGAVDGPGGGHGRSLRRRANP